MLKKLTKSNLKGKFSERTAEPPGPCWNECKTACGGTDILVDYLQIIYQLL